MAKVTVLGVRAEDSVIREIRKLHLEAIKRSENPKLTMSDILRPFIEESIHSGRFKAYVMENFKQTEVAA